MTPKGRRVGAAAAIVAGLAAGEEGIRFAAYYDPPGILTVCRGHTGTDVIKGKLYTQGECDALYAKDIEVAVNTVERCAPGLPPEPLAAFADAVFNIGPKIVCDRGNSTAARLLVAGRIEDACRQLPRWDKARVAGFMVSLPGLTRRRGKEMDLCLTPFASAPLPDAGAPDARADAS